MTFEDTVTVSIRWQYSGGLRQSFPEGGICSESVSNVWYCFSRSQHLKFQESRGGKGNSSTHHHLSDPLGKLLLPVPTTLSSADLEALVPEWGVLLPGAPTNIPLNWKLRHPSGHFGLLNALKSIG